MKVRKIDDQMSSVLIGELGGSVKVAEICGLKHPTVCGWRHTGIPRAWKKFLQLKFPNLKCWALLDKPAEAKASVDNSNAQ